MKIARSKKSYFSFFIVVILLIGAILRFISLDRECLWADEVLTYERGKLPVLQLFKIDNLIIHPPIYPVLINFWGRVSGLGATSMRVFSAFMGVIGIYLMFAVGRDLFGRSTGVIAAILLIISPMHIYFSQEARVHSMLISLVLFSFLALKKVLIKPERFNNFLMLAISQILLIYTHYTAFSIVGIQIATLVIFRKTRIWKQLVKYFLILLLAILPWSKTLMLQTRLLSENWDYRAFPGLLMLLTFLREFGSGNSLVAILQWLAFLSALMGKPSYHLMEEKKSNDNFLLGHLNVEKIIKLMLVFSAILPIIIVTICSIRFGFPFKLKYALVGFPSFVLLVSYGMTRLTKSNIFGFFLILLIVVAMVPSIYKYYHTNHNIDWRPVAKLLAKYWVPGETKLLVNLKDNGLVLRYYTSHFIGAAEFPEFSFYGLKRLYPRPEQMRAWAKNVKCVISLEDGAWLNQEEKKKCIFLLSSLFSNVYSLPVGYGTEITFYCAEPIVLEASAKDYSLIPPEELIWK